MKIARLTFACAALLCFGTSANAQFRQAPPAEVVGTPSISLKAPRVSHAADKTKTYTVPYVATFATVDLFNEFTVINANNDEKSNGNPCTWFYDEDIQTARYSYSGSNAADDWLISPSVYLEAGQEYKFVINCKNYRSKYYGDYEEKFEVKLGSDTTAESMTQTILKSTTVRGGSFKDYSAQSITVSKNGYYHIGVHCISDAYRGEFDVKSLKLNVIPRAGAPAAVTNLSIVPDPQGEPIAQISFNAPTKSYDGSELSGRLDIHVNRNGEELRKQTGVAPGQAINFTDNQQIPNGDNTYQIFATNSIGTGQTTETTVYVGVDVPQAVSNITFSEPSATRLTVNWNKVSTVGKRGYRVNPSKVAYAVYSTVKDGSSLAIGEQKGIVMGDTTVTFDNDNDNGTQDLKTWVVVPVNIAGVGDIATETHYGGTPYALPFEEHLAENGFNYPTWRYNASAPKYVILDLSNESTDGDNLALSFYSLEPNNWGVLTAGKISLNGADNPALLFDVKSKTGNSGIRVNIVTPDGKSTQVATATPETEYGTQKVSLNPFKNERYIVFEIYSDFNQVDTLNFDNFQVRDVLANDLSVSVSAPATAQAALTNVPVDVIVKNVGENEENTYSVALKVNGSTVSEKSFNETLQPQKSKTVALSVPSTKLLTKGKVRISAQVSLDGDLNEANNTDSADIDVVESSLPKPENLTSTLTQGGVELSWTAPSVAVKTVTEDFEDSTKYVPFSVGDIQNEYGTLGDWTIKDGDGKTNYGFNNFAYTNSGEPSAWQVFAPDKVSGNLLEEFPNYAAHSGKQTLIAWCPNDGTTADNWLISPILPGTAQTISFYYQALNDTYDNETLEILTSTSSDAKSDFTKLTELNFKNMEWKSTSIKLPEGTKHFAIRHVSTDVFGVMIDDITYTGGGNIVTGYRIYVDGEPVDSVDANSTSTTLPKSVVAGGDHIIAVTALYEGNEESAAAYLFQNVPTGITSVHANDVHAEDVYYNIAGQRVSKSYKGIVVVNGKKIIHR